MCDSCQFYPISDINTDQMNAHFSCIRDFVYAHNDVIQFTDTPIERNRRAYHAK